MTGADRTRIALLGVGAVAIALRVRQYATGRSLWHDEALLALGIREESVGDLVSHSLPNTQVAPPGFLVVEKGIAQFSSSDQWLRLVPFAASIALVWLAWRYTEQLRSGVAKVVFMVVLTWSPVLVYYSSELKQYGLDATMSIALIVSFADRRDHPRRLLWVGVVAVFTSHPAAIVLAGVCVSLAVDRVRAFGLRPALRSLTPFIVGWGTAVALVAVQIRQTNDGSEIKFFWADSFAPLPTSEAALRWWWESALGLVHLTTRLRGIASQRSLDEWTDLGVVLSLLLVVALVVVLARHDWQVLVLPIATLVLTLALAGFDIYPFRGRLILFLVPLVALLIAHGIDEIADRSTAAAVVLGSLVVAQLAWSASSVLVDPDDRFDIVEALERMEDGYHEGDVIVLGRGTGPAFDFYAREFVFDGAETRTVDVYDPAVIIEAGRGAPVWFLGSHVLAGDGDSVEEMDRSPLITEVWTAEGVVLRSFAAPAPAP